MNEHNARSAPATTIDCVDVHKTFGDVSVLRGAELHVERGEFVALTGASGCGKSTLLHLLAALDRPSSGSIVVNGHDLSSMHAVNRYRRLDVGIIFQLHNLLPRMSAGRNVELAMFGTGRSSGEREARAAELLVELDMGAAVHRSPTRLSGGERQRIAIARALANEPAVLLADEPTGNLDQVATDVVLGMLDRHRRDRQMTILMVTHDAAIARLADRHLHLEAGRVVP